MVEPNCAACPYNREGQQRVRGTDLGRERIVVGMAPGVEEAVRSAPFKGPSGRLIRKFLNGQMVGFTNAVECFPGQDINKKHFAVALECCAPRLESELEGKDVLVLGKDATEAVRGKKTAITKFRGTVTEGDLGTRQATYSLHPRHVLRAGGETSTPGIQLSNDVKQWVHGKKPRPEFDILINPKRLKLPPKGTKVVVDIETTGLHPSGREHMNWNGEQLPREEWPSDVGGKPRIRCYGFAWREDHGGRGGQARRQGRDARRKAPISKRGGLRPQRVGGGGVIRVVVFSEVNATVRRLLDGRYPLVAQNHAFEVKWLDVHGPWRKLGDYKGAWQYADRDWSDTMISCHHLHEDRGGSGDGEEENQGAKPGYRLDGMAEDFLEWSFPKDEMLAPYNVLSAPLEVLMPYCGWDCIKELLLDEQWERELELGGVASLLDDGGDVVRRAKPTRHGPPRPRRESGSETSTSAVYDVPRDAIRARIEHVALPGARFLERVMDRGMPWCDETAEWVRWSLQEQKSKLADYLGEWDPLYDGDDEAPGKINWNSDDQVRSFFGRYRLRASGLLTGEDSDPPDERKHALHRLAWSGIRSRNKKWGPFFDALIGPKYPGVKPLEGYRGSLKMLSDIETYARTVGPDSRVHGRLAITGTATGRLSASSPPLHGTPKVLRDCFVAPKGYSFLAMDVSGSEVSWQAHWSGDPDLEHIARERISLHDVTARELGIPRPAAKALNFALGYGGGGPATKKGMDLSFWGQYSIEDCNRLAAQRKAIFPVYLSRCQDVERFVAEHGYVITDFGWVRRLPDAMGAPRGGQYHRALRQAVNTLSQNPSSDALFVRAMEMERELALPIVLLKHDEILALVRTRSLMKTARAMKKIMSRREFYWGEVNVPLYVDFEAGECWGRLESLEV